MSVSLRYRHGRRLGSGAYGNVYYAIEDSGREVALKKSRASQRAKRTNLRYESRVLKLLQGHPAIPQLYAYGHLPHFEFLAMELLGPSLRHCTNSPESVKTVISIVLQMLSALEHVHKHGFVHRDIKPDNILYSLTDPSRIFLIDFGIAKHIRPPPPRRTDPLKNSRGIVGSLHFASLNAHDGIDLGPRDDLESLAYTAFSLLHGDLPWMSPETPDDPVEKVMSSIRASKSAMSGHGFCSRFHLPAEFGVFFDYSRHLKFGQTPNYATMITLFTLLTKRVCGVHTESPLDWNMVGISEEHNNGISDMPYIEQEEHFAVFDIFKEHNGISDKAHIERKEYVVDIKSDEDDDTNSDEIFENSYFSFDIGEWDIPYGRERSLTLPAPQAEMLDRGIPEIVEVIDTRKIAALQI